MSELAFNANGETFEVPASVTGWRVRRMKPRGAPELVYGRDGRPLIIPIESDTEDLRNAVMTMGKYRLDPVNEDGRTVENVSAAYIQVVKPSPDAAVVPTPASRGEHEDPVREAMRLNTELAKSVVDRFPDMMTAAAELLRAADGAGLPSRPPRVLDVEGDEIVDESEDAPQRGFDLNAFIAQVVPVLMAGLANGNVKMPGLAAMLDWRKATPTAAKRSKPQKQVEAEEAEGEVPDNALDIIPPIDPQTMAHFIAVQSALKPEEAAVAREVASKLTAAELRGWFDELSKLSVPQAVQKIRVLVAGNTEAVS
jgi:hypothetical protein